jgi:signal transduction histidine kinase/ligand-binding sensor domain-containing protein
MCVKRRIITLLWLAACLVSPALAQYRFDHWTADSGLPQNSVINILQTRDGYLWMTTSDGLARFDGVRFTVFNKHNSPGIANNRFLRIYEDARGDLWASTEGGEVTRRHEGRFTTYTARDGLRDDPFSSLGGDGQGNLVVLRAGQVLGWADGKFQPIAPPTTKAAPENNPPLLPCTWDSQMNTACLVDGQMRRWSLAGGLPDMILSGLARDQRGMIWASFEKHGLGRIEDGRLVKVYTTRDGLPGNRVKVVSGQRQQKAFSTDDRGRLWLTDLVSMQSHLVAEQPPEGLQDVGLVSAIHEDRDGNYWVGTKRDGLYRLRRNVVTTYSKSQGLTSDNIYPIHEDRDGVIWLGAQDAGLFRLKNGALRLYTDGAEKFRNYFTALHRDRAGRLWVGALDRVMRLEGERLALVNREIAPTDVGAYWAIHEDGQGALWFGAERGVVRHKDGASIRFTTKDGLAGDDTKVIVEDAAGDLWLGSYGGLTRYKDGRFTAWTEKDGLPSNTVRSLYPDSDGALWIGTYDGGLGRFKDGRFTSYTTQAGLFDNGVFQILEDDNGWFWMSCNRGIFRVRKQELNDFAAGRLNAIASIAYGKGDGMLNVECNGGRWPAGIKARDGRLWFPTQGGAAVIDPAAIAANPRPPSVLIEAFKIDNQFLTAERLQSAIRNPQSAIQLGPNQESFEIEYTALSFINSAHLKFKYKLEGLDHDWIDAGTRRTAYYSHFPPGDYTFRVIAANSDGVWNNEGASLRVVALPPFYRTWWFLTLAGLGAAGTVWMVFRFRLAQVERERAAQQAFSRQLIESQEGERKRIAAELHDGLGQSLIVIKSRAQLSLKQTGDPGEIEGQLTAISSASSQAIQELKDISYNLRPYLLDRLGLTLALKSMLNKAFASEQYQLRAEIDDLDGVFAKESEIHLYRIVQECANNIIKHAGASEVRVTIERNAGGLTLTMADNGKGFTPAAARTGELSGRGFGLAGIAERVRLLGGEHTVVSAPGHGTTIVIHIALKDGRHEQ